MTIKEKLSLLEEMLDVEEGTLKEDMELENIEEWDSMAAISLIALMDEKFGKRVNANQIKELKTIGDIINDME